MDLFTGSGVAIVTPFKDDLSINYDQFVKLIEFHIENGTDALIVSGTTGESPTISDDEKLKLFELAVKTVNGRIQVIAGTGSNNTMHVIELSQKAEALGVDGLLLVTPYYNKSTQAGLIAHFTAIADSINIPCILYNVPGRTGVNILPQTVKALSAHPNICALKEASGNISQIVEVASLVPDDFYIYSGNDDQNVPILSVGGKGAISVLGNIMPKETHDMIMDYLEGNIKSACELQLRTKALTDALFCEVNPIPVKAACNMMGLNAGPVRLPLVEISDASKQRLEAEMRKLDLI